VVDESSDSATSESGDACPRDLKITRAQKQDWIPAFAGMTMVGRSWVARTFVRVSKLKQSDKDSVRTARVMTYKTVSLGCIVRVDTARSRTLSRENGTVHRPPLRHISLKSKKCELTGLPELPAGRTIVAASTSAKSITKRQLGATRHS
jgi:hypothetical protein